MDTAPTPGGPVAIDDLAATVRTLTEELDRVKAELARRQAEPVSEPAEPAVGRRGALKRAGALALGAAAGGAAIVAGTASPAAAATVTGSGAPGVLASGVSGDGVDATTDADGNSAVYAHTGASGGYAVYAANNGGGLVIHGQGNVDKSGHSAYQFFNTGDGTSVNAYNDGIGVALQAASSSGAAASFENVQVNGDESVRVFHHGIGEAVRIIADGFGAAGIQIDGDGTHGTDAAIKISAFDIGANFSARKVGLIASGTNATLRLSPTDTVVDDATFQHEAGDVFSDSTTQALWHCVAGGTPGTIRKLSGVGTAGQLHILPAPVRVYDSRPGTLPSVAPKTPLVANTARTLDLTVNSSGVPAGATGVLVTVLLLNTASGNGNFTLWANGVARPSANTMVWGGAAGGRYTAKELSAVDPQAKVQVLSSIKADLALDVVGYYR